MIKPGKPIILKDHEKYQCNLCTDFFLTKESFDCHLNLDHGMKTDKKFCKDCRQSYTTTHNHCVKTYNAAYREKVKKQYFCPHCDPPKSVSTAQHLREHIKVIHEGIRYACPECDKQYSCKGHLKSHIQSEHLKQEDFECEPCGKKFGSRLKLKSHKFQSHSQTNCDICNKQVNSRFELKKHMVLIHNNTENAWICDVCPSKRVFFTQTMFNKHIESKH